MSLTVNTSDYEKWRIRRDNNIGNNGVNQIPNNNGVVPGSAADFELRYGPSIFGVDPNNFTPSGVERFNIAGANAGTAGGSGIVTDMNNPSNTSIWTQSGDFTNPTIQTGGPTAVGVVPLATPVALPATTGNDPTGKQGGSTEGPPQQQGPTFSASDIFALTGGLTVTNPAPAPALAPPANEPPPSSEPKPTGEATLTATNPEDVDENKGIGENPEVENPEKPDEKTEPTDTSNPDNVTGDNDENSGTETTSNTVKEDNKAAEEAAKKAAEEREEEQKAA